MLQAHDPFSEVIITDNEQFRQTASLQFTPAGCSQSREVTQIAERQT
jgi:hypothetical protein